ncbi:hypothetical protein GGF44_004356, partial [Coemansia sp. RSA 1694]
MSDVLFDMPADIGKVGGLKEHIRTQYKDVVDKVTLSEEDNALDDDDDIDVNSTYGVW